MCVYTPTNTCTHAHTHTHTPEDVVCGSQKGLGGPLRLPFQAIPHLCCPLGTSPLGVSLSPEAVSPELGCSPLGSLLGPEPQHHWRQQENIFLSTELVEI
jgi:hypothetical protein